MVRLAGSRNSAARVKRERFQTARRELFRRAEPLVRFARARAHANERINAPQIAHNKTIMVSVRDATRKKKNNGNYRR